MNTVELAASHEPAQRCSCLCAEYGGHIEGCRRLQLDPRELAGTGRPDERVDEHGGVDDTQREVLNGFRGRDG